MGKIHFFKRNIRYKLFAILLILTIIPIVAFGIVSYYMAARVMESDSIQNSRLSNEQVLNNMNNIISTLQQQSYSLNMSLKDILPIVATTAETNPNYRDVQERVRNYMSTLLLSNKNINSIIIYNLEGYPVFYLDKSGGSLPLVSSRNEAWFEKTLSLNGSPELLEPHSNNITSKEGRNVTVISISRALVDIVNSPSYETKGVLVVDCAVSTFAEAAGKAGSDVLNLIFSSGGNIIYASNRLNEAEYAAIYANIRSFGGSPFKLQLEHKKYLITSNHSSPFGWTAVTVVPISALHAKSEFIKQINITSAIIMVFLCLAGSIGLSVWITTPLKKLLRSFEKLQYGNFETQVEIKGNDEFSSIGKSFNMMVRNIKQLIKEKYELTLLHRQAELEILQSQINPHFLYNTLNSISAVTMRRDFENSVKMIKSLSDLFRYSLNKGIYIVTMADELKHIRQYLFLQHFRFADRFSVSYDIDHDALRCPIPRLALQPIVENAIIHGLQEADHAAGQIGITAKIFGDKCLVYVSNTGSLMASTKVDEMNALLATLQAGDFSKQKDHVSTTNSGLYNVCSRIKLLFGPEYGIKIMQSAESGTIVKVTLPSSMKPKQLNINQTGGDVYENSYRG